MECLFGPAAAISVVFFRRNFVERRRKGEAGTLLSVPRRKLSATMALRLLLSGLVKGAGRKVATELRLRSRCRSGAAAAALEGSR